MEVQQVGIEDEPFFEWVTWKGTQRYLKTLEKCSEPLTVPHNNSFHFALETLKVCRLASSIVASDFRCTCNKELLIPCLGKEHTRDSKPLGIR